MKLIVHLLAILLALSMTTGCAAPAAPIDGALVAMQPGATLNGIRSVLQGAAHTRIMTMNGVYMFAWPVENGWAFASVGKEITLEQFLKMTGGKGQLASAKTISDLAKFLTEKGWSVIEASAVPAALREAFGVTAAQVGSVLANTGVTLVSVMVLPIIPEMFPTQRAIQ